MGWKSYVNARIQSKRQTVSPNLYIGSLLKDLKSFALPLGNIHYVATPLTHRKTSAGRKTPALIHSLLAARTVNIYCSSACVFTWVRAACFAMCANILCILPNIGPLPKDGAILSGMFILVYINHLFAGHACLVVFGLRGLCIQSRVHCPCWVSFLTVFIAYWFVFASMFNVMIYLG